MKSVGVTGKFYKPQTIEKKSYWKRNINDIDIYLSWIPTIWNVGIGLCQFIDICMYLVFQDIVKFVIEFTSDFLAKCNEKK